MRKQKRLTKRQFAQMSEDYRLHNKKMKQSNNLSLCFSSFEGYLDWRFGRTPASTARRPSKTRTIKPARSYERSTRAQAIPSRLNKELKSRSDLRNATARPGSNSYSGTYVIGLATTHKSNIVPVGKGTDPKDYATMRRSN